MVEACRQELNKFIPDVYIYTDHYKGQESGLSPGYGVSLVAETTDGCVFSAERMAEKATMPEDLGEGGRGNGWDIGLWSGGADISPSRATRGTSVV